MERERKQEREREISCESIQLYLPQGHDKRSVPITIEIIKMELALGLLVTASCL